MGTIPSTGKRRNTMKMKALFVIASLFGMLIVGIVLESGVPLISAQLVEAKPRCEACR
jgi:hypothetical protein